MKRLQELHEPYENVTEWRIRKARRHAKECGAGFTVEKVQSHRIRLYTKIGTHKLKLDDGEVITTPNVIRTVTR